MLNGDGSGADSLDALRALCARWWSSGGGPVRVTGADARAEETVRDLGLDTAHGEVG
ncbi:MAG: hypothetical protein M3308_01055 [Actinomycetota bacterium]|nr:hypothetical protein [Actinomycetota bacterium]